MIGEKGVAPTSRISSPFSSIATYRSEGVALKLKFERLINRFGGLISVREVRFEVSDQ